jgi:EpsG family
MAALAAACIYFSLLSISGHLDADFVNYAGWYGDLVPYEWKSCDGFEPVFCFLGFIYQDFGFPFEYFVFSTSVAIYAILHLVIHKVYKSKEFPGFVAFFVTCLVIYIVFPPQMVSHLIRQYLAIGLLLLAMISTGRVRLLCALLALGFHFTVFVFLPFLLIAQIKLSRIHILILSIFALGLAFGLSPMISSTVKEFSFNHIDTAVPGGAVYDLFYKALAACAHCWICSYSPTRSALKCFDPLFCSDVVLDVVLHLDFLHHVRAFLSVWQSACILYWVAFCM